ncbi:two component system sensor histidine kinase, partial [human gut metagenome]
YVFDHMKRKKMKNQSMDELLAPLREWSENNTKKINELKDKQEEVHDELNVTRLHIEENKKRNLEQRAKISLVNSITPFIDRMIHEVNRLSEGGESDEVRQERYQYIAELTDKINQYNNVLTEWIQMRQGSLSLRIESFPLQQLFDIVSKGKMSFQMQGVKLDVEPIKPAFSPFFPCCFTPQSEEFSPIPSMPADRPPDT